MQLPCASGIFMKWLLWSVINLLLYHCIYYTNLNNFVSIFLFIMQLPGTRSKLVTLKIILTLKVLA